jgi:SAM-dependent methyltransferase
MGTEGVAAYQATLNRSVAGAGERYRGHREHVMSLLMSITNPGDDVMILGAGNGNDLDLRPFSARATTCTLVDIDPEALRRATTQTDPRAPGALRTLELDVTGAAPILDGWTSTDDGSIDELVRALGDGPSMPRGGCDVVASCCMLSQLTSQAIAPIGVAHPRAVEVAIAVRDAHLRLLASLLRPGGRALLLTDVASTETFPEIATAPEDGLGGLLREIEGTSGCFAGTSPAGAAHALRTDGRLAPFVEGVATHPPWRWQLLEDRLQLVVATSFTRREHHALTALSDTNSG